MKKSVSGIMAACLTSMMLLNNYVGFRPMAAQAVSLNIAKIELAKTDVSDDRIVNVDVRIDDNDAGFLAAEFGIVYDERLKLENIVQDSTPGNTFTWVNNDEKHLTWFSAASGNSDSTSSVGRQALFTLQFSLPENYDEGDVYPINYSWNSAANRAAYWYADQWENQIDWLSSHAITGSVKIEDTNGPSLSCSELSMNQKETKTIDVLNYEETCYWYTDHPDIAYFGNATINEVTALSPGTCTAYCLAGNTLLTCDITVTATYFYDVSDPSPIVISDPSQQVTIAYPNPEGTVMWMSTNTNVVTVSEDGVLTPVGNGNCQIIGTSNGITYARQVIVDMPEETTTTATTYSLNTASEQTTEETTTASSETTTEVTTTQETSTEPATEKINDPSYPNSKNTESAPPVRYGDVDMNGKVEMVDMITLNKYLMIGTAISEEGLKAADVNQDGQILPDDGLDILRYVIDLIHELPVRS